SEYVSRNGKIETISIQLATASQSRVITVSVVQSQVDYIIKLITGEPVLLSASINKNELFIQFLALLNDVGYKVLPKDIYLVAHFAQAEFGNFDRIDDIDLFQASKGLFGKYNIINPLTQTPVTIHVKDLFAILSTSLEKIGNYIGIGKLSLAGVGDKTESYWKEHMDELHKQFPDEFNTYAVRDAEICYHAYTKIRDFFLSKYEVDILHFNTLASIAGYIFRKDYLKEPVVPTRKIQVSINQRKALADKQTKYYKIIQKQEIYDGSLDIRKYALWSYHGGRAESFYRGRLEGEDLAYYDVVSLYPSSAMLQPLPCKETKWFNLAEVKETNPSLYEKLINAGEGFVELEFSFPKFTMYPCLPFQGARDDILYYPLNGVSWCTLSELRLALKLGLSDYKILSGNAFLPSYKEINHPIKQYMKDVLGLKNSSTKGSIEYELYKLLMNALVGKLRESFEDRTPFELARTGLLPRQALNKVARRLIKSKSVGSLWYPEGASLILGKARSIISEFVVKGAYLCSTDSVLLPKDTDISCASLNELRGVGSDLKQELDGSHGALIRARLSALNPLEKYQSKRHT
ncbi:MAG TPA: DNA polymerase, partial [Thermodesulfobacteriota bacterium]